MQDDVVALFAYDSRGSGDTILNSAAFFCASFWGWGSGAARSCPSLFRASLIRQKSKTNPRTAARLPDGGSRLPDGG
jgi:hypothetical protein